MKNKKPITEKDLELQFQSDTGLSAHKRVTDSYSRGFYDWCLEQLLILKNMKTKDETTEHYLE